MNPPSINGPNGERRYVCMFPATPGDGPKAAATKVNEPARREAPDKPGVVEDLLTSLCQLVGGLLLFALGAAMVVGLVLIVLLAVSHGRL